MTLGPRALLALPLLFLVGMVLAPLVRLVWEGQVPGSGAWADLSLAGQLRPGDALRLVQVTHVEALEALRAQEHALRAAMVMARL